MDTATHPSHLSRNGIFEEPEGDEDVINNFFIPSVLSVFTTRSSEKFTDLWIFWVVNIQLICSQIELYNRRE